MAQEQSCPNSDQTHDAARGANQLFSLIQAQHAQQQNTEARAQPGNQITNRKSNRANRALQARADNEERIQIKEKVERAVMQEERSKKTPILALKSHGKILECAQLVQRQRIGRPAEGIFRREHREV